MSENSGMKELTRRPAFWIAIAAVTVAAFSFGLMVSGGGSAKVQTPVVAKAEVWTCSMHPQIKLPKPGKCPICFMELIPLAGDDGGDSLGPRQLRMSESSKQLAQIETTPVIRGDATQEMHLYGKVMADESRVAKVTARIGGRIDRLYVNTTGQSIRRGEKMIDLYSPELLSAQKELVQASASIAKVAQSNSDILKSTAAATVAAAKEKLRLVGLTDEQIGEIADQGEASEQVTILAPSSGTVIEKMVAEGQYVEAGMDLFEIADLSQLWVVLEAYESDVPFLKIGDEVTFTTQAQPGEAFRAKVSFINPTLDPMSRTVAVRAVVDNSDRRLKPDMFVDATMIARGAQKSDAAQGSLLAPESAVLITGKRAVVYVQLPSDDGPLFEGREVELGPKVGGYYVIRSGLSEGEMVVTNGAFKLDSELQIQAKPSMMSPEGGIAPAVHNHATMTETSTAAEKTVAISSAARAALAPVYDKYFEFQMALAGDDLATAKAAAEKTAAATEAVDMMLFSGSTHTKWMELAQEIGKQAKAAAGATDIEQARGAFFHLSKAMISLHENFGHSEARNYYLTFCPMARNNAGAYWLQTVDTVYNSFYGAAMLRCGEIKKPLKASIEN